MPGVCVGGDNEDRECYCMHGFTGRHCERSESGFIREKTTPPIATETLNPASMHIIDICTHNATLAHALVDSGPFAPQSCAR